MRFSYTLFLLVAFATGLCSLVYQVVWQKYLSILIGSEAKSSSLVVGIFLIGIALGYFVWGRVTLKVERRKQLLKMYGYVELLTGFYAVFFPSIFETILPFAKGLPNWFISDFFIAGILILPPTFLMGATIPMLTSCLPKTSDEINNLHAKIYGINTLGAFLGCLIGGLWLIPSLGLPVSIMYAGGLNVFVAVIYIANKLDGKIDKPERIPSVESHLGSWQIYLLVFCSGLVSISLEIIWFRIWGLTIGNSSIVFPMVLALFVLGLGYGGLTIKELSFRQFKKELTYFLIAVIFSYWAVPFLPVWVSRVRVLFVSAPYTYVPFYLTSGFILALVILPFVVPLGRILPMGYAFLKKEHHNYGERCGMLYFINTLGTFFGAIVFSYLFLYFLDINHVYLINIFIFLAIYLAFVVAREKKVLQFFLVIGIALVPCLYQWNRDIHVLGNFRTRSYNAGDGKSLLTSVSLSKGRRALALKDGPNTTVAVLEVASKDPLPELAIMVNGKSDSSTNVDFATTVLAGVIPYLYQYDKDNLKTSVVGLGTGVSVGVLGQLAKVKEVDALEISPFVVKMNHFFNQYNWHALENPKVNTHVIDAFKFYIKNDKKYDIIVSEPTNPWVVGVENLYTQYYYELLEQSLVDDGVVAQWMQSYAINKKIMATVMKNMGEFFPFVKAYRTSGGDILLLGFKEERGSIKGDGILSSPDGPFIRELLERMSIPSIELVNYLEIMSSDEVVLATEQEGYFYHDILAPSLSFKALKSFYTGERVDPDSIPSPLYVRQLSQRSDRGAYFKVMVGYIKNDTSYCTRALEEITRSPLCKIYKTDLDHYNFYRKRGVDDFTRLKAYGHLRYRGIIEQDLGLLQELKDQLVVQMRQGRITSQRFISRLEALFVEMANEGLWDKLFQVAEEMNSFRLINKEQYKIIMERYGEGQEKVSKNLEKWGLSQL